jgi:hypothetical protein
VNSEVTARRAEGSRIVRTSDDGSISHARTRAPAAAGSAGACPRGSPAGNQPG